MRERRGMTPPPSRGSGMRIGIVCYASVGGSGVVATELATSLARRGHEVHVLSSEIPFRLRDARGPVVVHAIETPAYPLFREPQYVLSLSTKIVNVARAHALDIIHAHYAVPHAAGAYLARQILASHGAAVPKVVTTLHGTDITLVGADPSYRETVAFCIEQSDGVTAVSESLRDDTYRHLRLTSPIVVVPNFLDCGRYTPMPDPALRARLCPPDRYDSLLLHVSNFRPVKRLDAVVDVFRRVRAHRRAKIVLVGDGPERSRVEALAREAGLAEHLEILGELDDVRSLLSIADAFLLPSAQESFGLAALEAMACGVPVVASRVGGLPEVITDGLTGYLRDPDDHAGMAAGRARPARRSVAAPARRPSRPRLRRRSLRRGSGGPDVRSALPAAPDGAGGRLAGLSAGLGESRQRGRVRRRAGGRTTIQFRVRGFPCPTRVPSLAAPGPSRPARRLLPQGPYGTVVAGDVPHRRRLLLDPRLPAVDCLRRGRAAVADRDAGAGPADAVRRAARLSRHRPPQPARRGQRLAPAGAADPVEGQGARAVPARFRRHRLRHHHHAVGGRCDRARAREPAGAALDRAPGARHAGAAHRALRGLPAWVQRGDRPGGGPRRGLSGAERRGDRLGPVAHRRAPRAAAAMARHAVPRASQLVEDGAGLAAAVPEARARAIGLRDRCRRDAAGRRRSRRHAAEPGRTHPRRAPSAAHRGRDHERPAPRAAASCRRC